MPAFATISTIPVSAVPAAPGILRTMACMVTMYFKTLETPFQKGPTAEQFVHKHDSAEDFNKKMTLNV